MAQPEPDSPSVYAKVRSRFMQKQQTSTLFSGSSANSPPPAFAFESFGHFLPLLPLLPPAELQRVQSGWEICPVPFWFVVYCRSSSSLGNGVCIPFRSQIM